MTIDIKKIKPYLNLILLVGILSVIIYLVYFLFFYFYPALTGSQEIFTLQNTMSVQSVDISKFNNLVDTITKKSVSAAPTATTTNPFK